MDDASKRSVHYFSVTHTCSSKRLLLPCLFYKSMKFALPYAESLAEISVLGISQFSAALVNRSEGFDALTVEVVKLVWSMLYDMPSLSPLNPVQCTAQEKASCTGDVKEAKGPNISLHIPRLADFDHLDATLPEHVFLVPIGANFNFMSLLTFLFCLQIEARQNISCRQPCWLRLSFLGSPNVRSQDSHYYDILKNDGD